MRCLPRHSEDTLVDVSLGEETRYRCTSKFLNMLLSLDGRHGKLLSFRNVKILVLRFQLILATSYDCSLYFTFMFTYEVVELLKKVDHITSLVVDFIFQHRICGFTCICCELTWWGTQTTLFPHRTKHGVPKDWRLVILKPSDEAFHVSLTRQTRILQPLNKSLLFRQSQYSPAHQQAPQCTPSQPFSQKYPRSHS